MPQLNQCIKGGSIDKQPGWVIGFHYSEEVVEKLKEIPHIHREWREESKTWWVSDMFSEHLKKIFPNFEALAYQQKKMF